MKLKNCKRVVLPTVMAALLVSIPAPSNAYSITGTTYSNSATVKSTGGYYTVTANQDKTTTTTSKNYYIISRGRYHRPNNNTNNSVEVPKNDTTTPVVKPTPQEPTQPKPEPTPVPNPDTGSNTESNTGSNTGSNTESNTGSTSNGKHSLSAAEIKMVELVNKERQAAGLKALEIDVDLAYVARIKSQDMNDNNYFSHDSPTYGSPFDMMKQFGIKYRGAAENIAKNSSVEGAHNAFMRSSGHKANIMNSNYTHIGIGIVNGYYTQMFISK